MAIQQKFITIILFCLLTTCTATPGFAQSSGLQIGTSGEIANQIRNGKFSGIEGIKAVLRKTVVNTTLNQQTAEQLRNPVSSTKQKAAKETITKAKIVEEQSVKETEEKVDTAPKKDKKTAKSSEPKQNLSINPIYVPKTTIITSATIYDIIGATAIPTRQYTSLQASFLFLFFNRNSGVQNPVGLIELYKLEKGVNTRSFCIPSGGCASINIPIQITTNGQPVIAGAGVSTAITSGYAVVLSNGGYLQPGEYAFIDKSSLIRDGSSLICFTFSVKQ